MKLKLRCDIKPFYKRLIEKKTTPRRKKVHVVHTEVHCATNDWNSISCNRLNHRLRKYLEENTFDKITSPQLLLINVFRKMCSFYLDQNWCFTENSLWLPLFSVSFDKLRRATLFCICFLYTFTYRCLFRNTLSN